MKRTFLDTVWYQCLVLTTQFRKGAWQEINLNHAHHTCELKSISFWTIDLAKRELNIFHTLILRRMKNRELFCPKISVKSCAQINRFERSSIYSYLQRDLPSWTEDNVIIMWNSLLNTAKKFWHRKEKTGYDNNYIFESKYRQICMLLIFGQDCLHNQWRKRTNQKHSKIMSLMLNVRPKDLFKLVKTR